MPIDLSKLTKPLQDLGYPESVYRTADPQTMVRLLRQAASGELPRFGTRESRTLLDSMGVKYTQNDINRAQRPARSAQYDIPTAEGTRAAKTRSKTSSAATPAQAPAAPEYGDIVGEQLDYYHGKAEPIYQGQMDAAGVYRGGIDALANEWAQGQLDSSGYQGLGAARDEYMNTYNQGGLTDVTRANLEKSRREEDQWIRAQRESQLQDLAERGMAGSGAEVAGLMHDRAAAADRMSARDLDTHAFAQQQAMEALGKAADANRDIYGYDVDRLTGVRDYKSEGIQEENSVMKDILENDRNVLNGLMENFINQSNQLENLSASNVLPAAQSGSATVREGITNLGANQAEVLNQDSAQQGQTGADLTNLVGGQLPTPGPVQPTLGLGSGATTGAAIGNAGSTALDAIISGVTAAKKPNAQGANLQGGG